MLPPERVAGFALLARLTPPQLAAVAGLASEVAFAPGQLVLVEGRAAERCWLLRSGRIEMRVHRPGAADAVVQTYGAGDELGWSWLVPPHRWRFDAVATTRTEAVEFDAVRLRELTATDSELGYGLALCLLEAMADQLHGARARLADVYRSSR